MARLPIDFGDPDAETQALQDYTSRLPVELPQSQPGYTHTYQPGWDAQLAQEEANKANPLVFAPAIREGLTSAGQLISGEKQLASPSEMLSHVVGPNRLQMWPEQLIRSGFTLPHDVMTGEVPVWDGEHTSPELIQRTQDLAGMAGGGFAAKPNAVVAAAKSSELAPLAALEHATIFYSALEHAVQNAKVPKANAEDWLGYLRNQPGVKQEELDWVLHDLPKGSITKSELEQFVNSHKVELKEVNKGLEVPGLAEAEKAFKNYSQTLADKYDLNPLQNLAMYSKMKKMEPTEIAEYERLQNAYIDKTNEVDKTKYSQWQLPGGYGYKEQLLTLPEKGSNFSRNLQSNFADVINKIETTGDVASARRVNPQFNAATNGMSYNEVLNAIKEPKSDNPYISSHWPGIVNPVAHIRTNERAIPGVGNSLHIEEIQSDWHQKGRKEGYQGEKEELQPKFDAIEKKIVDSGDEQVMSHPELKDALKMAVDKGIITKDEATTYQRYSNIESGSPVPNAPFKSNWADLALKRVIRQAAENGHNSISWTPGEAQAARYDLSKEISKVTYNAPGSKLADKYGTVLKAYDHKGNEIINKNLKPKELADAIGKEAAEKLLKSEKIGDKHQLEGLDLKVGGEGMKAFYDKMLVDKANAIAKKFGGKVEQSKLTKGRTKAEIDKDADSVIAELQKREPDNATYEAWQRHPDLHQKHKDLIAERNLAHDKIENVHVLRITPQLRDAALNKGFSLFADTGKVGAPLAALTRVEHNPFKLGELEQQHGVKLTPVDRNPFTVDTYHGTPKPFKGSELRTRSLNQFDIDPKHSEFFSTPNPELAADYSGVTLLQKRPDIYHDQGRRPNILPLKIDPREYHTVDAKGQPWDAVNQFAINEAHQLNKKGVILHNVLDDSHPTFIGSRGPQTVYITLDPSTVRSRFAKFDPKLFGESGLLKSSGIPIEINNQNGQDPFIDNTHTVPYGAGASNNGLVVHIDSSIPRFDTHTGDLDLYKPLALHERTEKKLMDAGMPYEYAHKIATEAEKGYVGDRWKEYEKVMDGYLKKTENEKPSNPPSNLYLKPYPHNKQELLEKYGTHSPEGEPSSVGISGKTAAIGAAKAAEWAAFVGARNYPKIAGPMYASWVAQWPLLGHMLKADVRKQLNAGVKPEDIEFKPGTIGDLFGLVSKLKAKYGDKADKLEPIDHNPFAEGK